MLDRRVLATAAGVGVAALALAGATAAAGTAAAQTTRAAARVLGTVAPASGWGLAQQVPGVLALNRGGAAEVTALSCMSVRDCSAGGYYTDGSGDKQPFVAAEENGTWGAAEKIPGMAALNHGPQAQINSMSCVSVGNCSAGGFYQANSSFFHFQAFVVTERDGHWGKAEEVPGTATLNRGNYAQVLSVSCWSPGNCGAGGYYWSGNTQQQAFVVSEVDGAWRDAVELPGSANLNRGRWAEVTSVSCPAAGNCGAGGFYSDGAHNQQSFVAGEAHGAWGTAQEVPGTAAMGKGATGGVFAVSCPAAGNCGAGGYYTNHAKTTQAFAVDEVHGTWGHAAEVRGVASLNAGGDAGVSTLSCASPGDCGLGGYYTDRARHTQGFVADEVDGTWGSATEVPGTAALNTGGDTYIASVSCPAAGNCGLGGYYRDRAGHFQGFVADEVEGTWDGATEVAGTPGLNKGGFAAVLALSCPSVGDCGAGGFYTPRPNNRQPFVVTERRAG